MKRHLFSTLLLTTTAFAGFAQAPSIDNPGFEPWETYTAGFESRERPESWFGSDEITGTYGIILTGMGATPDKQIFKSTDKHAGDFAARLVTINLSDSLGNIPGVLTNAQLSIDIEAVMDPEFEFSDLLSSLTYTGGTPMYGKKVDTVSAWVKTAEDNMDASMMIISAMKKQGDSMVAIGSGLGVIMPGESGYRKVSVAMEYEFETAEGGTATDTLIIAFLSSAFSEDGEGEATEGNTLLVDDVELVYSDDGSSIHQPVLSETKVLVHPNPAKDMIWFNLNVSEQATDYELFIADISGRNIYSKQLATQINGINIANWASGTYIYNLVNKKTGTSTSGKFVK